MGARYTFTSELWEWTSRANWFFVSLPEAESGEIRQLPFPPAGFNSIPVIVVVGGSRWRTSIFPGGDGRYVLPIKASVRVAEGIGVGDPVTAEVELRD